MPFPPTLEERFESDPMFRQVVLTMEMCLAVSSPEEMGEAIRLTMVRYWEKRIVPHVIYLDADGTARFEL